MNKQHYQKSVEIDIKDLIWRLLSQWKAIVIASLLMALLICGAKHLSDVKDYKADIEKAKKASEEPVMNKEENIEAILDSLSSKDRAAVEYVVKEQNWLSSQKEYLDNSILMSTDPTNQRELKLIYNVIAARSNYLPVLVQSYFAFMSGNDMAEAIKPYFGEDGKDKDNKYLIELITLSNQKADNDSMEAEVNSVALIVDVVLTEDTDADAVIKAMSECVSGHSAELNKTYPHTISLADTEVAHEYDSTNVNKKSSAFSGINSLEKTLKDANKNLSDTQQAALEKILSLSSETGESAASKADTKEAKAPGYSKKYAVLGFILGAMLYTFIFVLLAVFRGCVGSAAAAEKYTDTRMLGEIYEKRRDTALNKLMHSSFFEKLYHKGKTDSANQIRKIASSADAICEHEGVRDLTVLDFTCGTDDTDTVGKIVEAMKEKNIKTCVMAAGDDIDEKELAKSGKVIYALSEGVKAETLWNVLNLCKDYDKDGIGSIWLGEI